MSWVHIWQACLGLGGAMIYATNKLWTALCAGDIPPTARARGRAWGQFATALLAGTLFAATMTDWITSAGPFRHAPWPPVAVTIGLFGNTLWPLVLKASGESIRARIIAWLNPPAPPAPPAEGSAT